MLFIITYWWAKISAIECFFAMTKFGKFNFFDLLRQIAKKLTMLWLRAVLGPKVQCISSLLNQSDQAFKAKHASTRLIEGPIK